jgi:methionyl-tRNA formyltransferase
MAALPHITVVAEPDSWVRPFAKDFAERHGGRVVASYEEIEPGGIAIFFGCTRIAGEEILARSIHNLVAHQSDLPAGRGWSPLAWQIIEGKNEIPVALFEAVLELDAGPVYFRDTIHLEGHELSDELRRRQAESAVGLFERFLAAYPDVVAEAQEGTPTFFSRRTPEDCRLDPDRTISEQFDLLRICDNERFPAFFYLRGHRYVLQITRADADSDA